MNDEITDIKELSEELRHEIKMLEHNLVVKLGGIMIIGFFFLLIWIVLLN